LESLQENDDIDFLLLNENLPGEKIESFLEKLPKIKTIIFTEKSRKKQENFKIKGAYKIYQNGEVSLDEIKEIIKEKNYTEDLEKEIERLKKQIEEKDKPKKIKFSELLKKLRFTKVKRKHKEYKITKEIDEKQIKLEIVIKVK